VLELEGVDVPFGDEPGLRDVDLSVQAGERFVLVGASGAGKSSLLRAIAGTGRIASGTVRIDGEPVAGGSPRDRQLVLLEQRPLLFPHMSVSGNLAFPLEVRGIDRDEIERRVAEALDAVRLTALGQRMPDTLSGGQAHRAALARAVIARPKILLLDEPLAALDPTLREEMRNSIIEVAARYGAALLIVTHDLREAARTGERVGVLIDGRLAQVDTPDALFQRPSSLPVARFIGWRNELPAEVAPDGSVRVGRCAILRRWAGDGDEPYPPGAATLSFGANGAHLRDAGAGTGVPVRVTALLHDPYGVTAEYRLETSSGVIDELACSGEVTVDASEAPQVGSLASLEVEPSRARIFPTSD
jgi:ABC-type sugar transport system ATPase subunit